ncbi:hypothetical protein PAPYR_3561 [Paratrimastix pyriformis]|uniref:Uncharacterized protein n=1 Tax=Paratrimastix pyriformis TaxID=342808 RepID=A0ABQ8UR42_9EUKA|nr:hypothetical protein PAPYR_3561 [Paratrimastix pyriformis]
MRFGTLILGFLLVSFVAASNYQGNVTKTDSSWQGILTETGSTTLSFAASPLTAEIFRVHISAPGSWEVPGVVQIPSIPFAGTPRFDAVVNNNAPFSFVLAHNTTTKFKIGESLEYSDGHRSVALPLPADAVVTSPVVSQLTLETGAEVPIWAGSNDGAPFLTVIDKDGTAFGILLLNSHLMLIRRPTDTELRFDHQWAPTHQISICPPPQITGGSLDFYVLAGPSPAAVLSQLAALTGRPIRPPRDAFGLHHELTAAPDKAADLLTAIRDAKVPLESLWLGLSYESQCTSLAQARAANPGLRFVLSARPTAGGARAESWKGLTLTVANGTEAPVVASISPDRHPSPLICIYLP